MSPLPVGRVALLMMLSFSLAQAAETASTSTKDNWMKAAGSLLNSTGGTQGALSSETIAAGLKAGLDTGVDRALAELGKPDGFLKNAAFKIMMPPELAKTERTLRKLKQDQLADDLVASLNRAAETSVAETAPIFKQAIAAMSLDDALGILKGPPDAATAYFRKTTETALRTKMLPIVKSATDANGVGNLYKQFSGKVSPFASLFGAKSVDLDTYVCDHALDSLFKVIATQEASLRANPAGSASKLIQQVFSATKK